MDTWEGSRYDAASLHRYLYSHLDPVNRVDPSGLFDLRDVTSTLLVMSILASQALTVIQNVAYSIYLNLNQVPQLVDKTNRVLIIGTGALEIATGAFEVLGKLAHNVTVSNTAYSEIPVKRGVQVGEAAQQNLGRTFKGYDHF
jgi:hypothetical protein